LSNNKSKRLLVSKQIARRIAMPYPYQDSFSCPACGEKICTSLGTVKETYECPGCEKVIHIHIWVDDNSPEPIDRRNIC
jgi:predicted RNA-binding Zn-ribbon protein involved in translation (DUF1610 family)